MKGKFLRRIGCEIILPAMAVCCGAAAGEKPVADSEPSPVTGTIVNKPARMRTSLKCKNGTELSYGNFGEGFLLNYCTTCHSSDVTEDNRMGAPAEINLDSSEALQIWRARIQKVVQPIVAEPESSTPDEQPMEANNAQAPAESSQIVMPPDQNLAETDRALFLEWLNCGATQ